MQKKFIALAVAGLVSGAAFAQSNVTIYGVADVGIENVSATGATATNVVSTLNTASSLPSRSRMESNSSYIGFKGSEALGNGLTAVFQVETQIAMDNAQNGTAGTVGNTFANRDSFVGIAGSFGTVIGGYLSTPYRSMGAKFDVMPGATGAAGFNGLVGHINVGDTRAADGTTNNSFVGTKNLNGIGRSQAVAYVTPTFSGFSAVAAYTTNENKAVDTANSAATTVTNSKLNPSAWNVAANYDNGPLSLGYSYLKASDFFTVAGSTGTAAAGTGISTDAKAHLLAARYVFNGATTVSAMWNQTTATINNVGAAAIGNEYKTNVWYLGLKHVMGQHEIAAMYARAADGSVSNANNGTENSSDRGAQQFGLRYAFNFSKRTQAYALWTRIDNKANGNYDFGNGNSVATNNSTATTALAAGNDPQVFGAGIRHSF